MITPMSTYILVDGKLQFYKPIDLPNFKVDHKSDTPDQFQWLYLICEHLDMHILNTFPVYFDGQGCSILQDCGNRKLGFLAVLNFVYDEDIFIWIPSETDLLDFYALVQPMLMLQSCKRFWDKEESGYWCRGESFRSVKQCRKE